tara:strand:- start:5310 stop:6722 length:1413 start_codon:yes stop_codon:yes gene_type:complete
VENVLASRYASQEMVDIWSAESRVILERELWVAVLKAQKEFGIEIDDQVIKDYESAIHKVDLGSIRKREEITRHDVKARLEEFSELAGHQHVHKGMTSRDLTENVEQLQIKKSLDLVLDLVVASLSRLGRLAAENSSLMLTGRTHNVAAQPTTLGKRFANTAEELINAYNKANFLYNHFPLRGLKGAVGTQQDLLDLFEGNFEKVDLIEKRLAEILEFDEILDSVGQVYPRSLDFEVIAALVQISSAPENFSKTIRLMAGHNLLSEGFQEGQVGSSAMPHKTNTRTSERISGLSVILKGYLSMFGGLVGDQWNEGDVSCSVVRRVALPDSFFTIDGLFQSFITVLDELVPFPEVIEKELLEELPYLSTTRLLMAAVQKGVGRETAHEIISEHARKSAASRREASVDLDFVYLLANDDRFPLQENEINQLFNQREVLIGNAPNQVQSVVEKIADIVTHRPLAASYKPEPII